MTYDRWKTTDPRENEREDEDQPSELELAYDRIKQLEAELGRWKHIALAAAITNEYSTDATKT